MDLQVQCQAIADHIATLGAHAVAYLPISDIVFDQGFRTLCAMNSCGNYGRNWMCPPFAGEIEDLIASAQSYRYMVVYQTVGQLEDSYDFEGMMAAADVQNHLTQQVRDWVDTLPLPRVLHLGAGGCHVCPTCAKREELPCRFPQRAIASLETYGIDVSQLARACGLNYINGQNTATYFSGVLLGSAN